MINKYEFAEIMAEGLGVLKAQTEGLSHEDSLIQPQPGGNCLNWVVGHLVWSMVDMMAAIGGEVPSDLPDLSHYGYGSEPVRKQEKGVHDLHVLINHYAELVNDFTKKLEHIDEDAFDDFIEFFRGPTRRGYVLFFDLYHNTLHLGQLEQLRNLAGRTEKLV